MKNTLSLIIFLLTLPAYSAALWSFRVPVDGLLSNGVAVSGLTNALAPTFTPSEGAVPLSVTIASAGNLIYYTTNGDAPTTNLAGIPSGTEVTVNSTNQPLKALAWFADGYRNPSTVTTAYYTNAEAGAYNLVDVNTSTSGHDYMLIGTAAERQQMATKWVPTATTNINRIELLLGKIGAGNLAGTLTGYIYGTTAADATGVPTNALATAATVVGSSLASVGTSNWVAFDFSSPQPVTNGATYWIVLKTDQSPSFTDYLGWWAGDEFADNYGVHGADDSSWTNTIDKQLNFKTYSP